LVAEQHVKLTLALRESGPARSSREQVATGLANGRFSAKFLGSNQRHLPHHIRFKGLP